MAVIAHDTQAEPTDFGAKLRKRRRAMRLTQEQLAKAAGLSLSTIKALERGAYGPRPDTVARLRAALGEDCAEPAHTYAGSGFRTWTAVHYDPMGDLDRLRLALQSPGYEIEPKMLYLTEGSARAWLALCQQKKYVGEHRETLPMRQVAQIVISVIGAKPITVIALGSGDAQSETRLVQHLIERRGGHASGVALHLLDYSHALMMAGRVIAQERLEPQGVQISGIAADFNRLPEVIDAWGTGPDRCNVFAVLGWTLGNQPDEARLLENVASVAQPGDFLIFDFTIVYAPAEDRGAILRNDPALTGRLSPALADWLSLSLRRFFPTSPITMAAALGPELMRIPGSYEVRCMGTVRESSKVRTFLVSRGKRYHPGLLQAALRHLGWDAIACLPIGGDQRDCLMVARRLG